MGFKLNFMDLSKITDAYGLYVCMVLVNNLITRYAFELSENESSITDLKCV